MKRIAFVATTLTIAVLVSPIALYAQRAGGFHGSTGPVLSAPRATPPSRGPGRGGEGRGGGMGRGGFDGRGNAINVRVHPAPQPLSPGGSVDHPLPRNLNSVNPAPALGLERTPSPFRVGPRYYNRQLPYSIPYGVPYGYGYGAPDYGDTYATTAPPPPPEEDTALLLFDVTPSAAMVSVDNAFVGSASDLRSGLELTPGHHWIDLEASGYDKKTFEVNAIPGRPARYQAELTPLRTALPASVSPRPQQTMYAIPGCYGGNTPPVQANLPKGCSVANVRVLRPPK